MAKTKRIERTDKHYPIKPFRRHAGYPQVQDGRHYIEFVSAGTGDFEPPALSDCSFTDPLCEQDQARLVGLGLGHIDPFNGVFEIDYGALAAHLTQVCGVDPELLKDMTWPSILEKLSPAEPNRQEPVSERAGWILTKLRTLPEHEAMDTSALLCWLSHEHKTDLDDSTLRRLLAELKPYGLRNKPKVGYFIG